MPKVPTGNKYGMKITELQELFDPHAALPLQWDDQFGPREMLATAWDRQGRQIDINFTPLSGGVEIEFTRGGSYEVTGRGDATLVLNTVIQAIRTYLTKYNASEYVMFSGSGGRKGTRGGSRNSLYQALSARLAAELGYRVLAPGEYPAELRDDPVGMHAGMIVLGKNVPQSTQQPQQPMAQTPDIMDTGTHNHLDENLMELTFHGSTCTKDCSGHRAGYQWSLNRGGVQNPQSASQSFVNGSNIGHRMVQTNKQQRTQGGGKIAGHQSQSAQATQKRVLRTQARLNRGVQGTPD